MIALADQLAVVDICKVPAHLAGVESVRQARQAATYCQISCVFLPIDIYKIPLAEISHSTLYHFE